MFCVRGYDCHLEKLLFPKEEMIVEVFRGKARQMRAPLKPRSHHLQVKIFLFVFSADIFWWASYRRQQKFVPARCNYFNIPAFSRKTCHLRQGRLISRAFLSCVCEWADSLALWRREILQKCIALHTPTHKCSWIFDFMYKCASLL